jgi:hypothetical protein
VLSSLTAAAAVAAAAAIPASASQVSASQVSASQVSTARSAAPSGPQAQYTAGAPGYGATNADGFEQATETTTLVKDQGVFSSSYQPFVTLENSTSSTSTPEVELIPTTSSSAQADSWFPNADDSTSTNSAKFFWIQPRPFPASSPCASEISLSSGRGCFYAGETVTLTVSYNTGSNTAYLTITDPSNGDEYAASLPYSSGPLTTAHLGDVWLSAYGGSGFTAPNRPEQLNSFSDVTLTDTSGRTRALGDWTHFPRIMTSNGQSSGQVEIAPSPLGWNGKSFGLTVEQAHR